MTVALIPGRSPVLISLQVRPEEPFPIVEVYHYSITNPMFLLLTVSLSCKYSFPVYITIFLVIVVCLIITTTCVH